MILLKFIVTIAWILFVVFIFTQIIVPSFTGRKLFPMLNKKRSYLSEQVIELNELRDLKEAEKEVNKLKQSVINEEK